MPTHSSSSSSPPEGVLRAALALVHARLDPKLALAVLIVFCFRRVLYTLVPIRPRPRGERRSLRTLPGASLRPPLAGFNPDTPRRLSTPLLTPFNSTPTSLVLWNDPQRRRAQGVRDALAPWKRLRRTPRGAIDLLALVPIRPRSRRERRSLRTFSPGVRFPPPRVPRWFQSRRTATPPFNSTPD
jgi:hypothetical protein